MYKVLRVPCISTCGLVCESLKVSMRLRSLKIGSYHLAIINAFFFYVSLNPQEPAGAIASSANDMAKWLKLHLQNGQLEERQLLNHEWLEATYTSYVPLMPKWEISEIIKKPTFPVTWTNMGYGYGWVISEYQGVNTI